MTTTHAAIEPETNPKHTPSAKLFAVSANWDYEGGTAIAVFDSEESAKAFAFDCESHRQSRPVPPQEIEDTPGNDAEWYQWGTEQKAWLESHPAGRDADSFSVYELPYFKATGEQT